MTTVVRGGTVVAGGVARPADVVVDGERIVDVVEPGTADVTGAAVLDAGGLVVLPGAVDPHVHFDEPGRAHWEGFDTGSAAAAAGGVTTVVDMPIDSDPPTVTAPLLVAKAAAAERSSRVDVALWGGLTPASVRYLHELAVAGAVGFKAFLCASGWADFPAADDRTLVAGAEAARAHDLVLAVHCELDRLGRSEASEVEAVRAAARAAALSGARLHVVHASSACAVDEAGRWPDVTVETCPHYLLLDADEAEEIGPAALCSPPIRGAANRDRLWDQLAHGAVSVLASDHSPCPPTLKTGDSPWAGISGVETTVPAVASAGRLDLVTLADRLTAAGRLLRLPGKGAIAPGFDADLCLLDLDRPWTVGPETLWCRFRQSPFTGRTFTARVVRTLVRGRTVFSVEDGPSGAGGGRFLRPAT